MHARRDPIKRLRFLLLRCLHICLVALAGNGFGELDIDACVE